MTGPAQVAGLVASSPNFFDFSFHFFFVEVEKIRRSQEILGFCLCNIFVEFSMTISQGHESLFLKILKGCHGLNLNLNLGFSNYGQL